MHPVFGVGGQACDKPAPAGFKPQSILRISHENITLFALCSLPIVLDDNGIYSACMAHSPTALAGGPLAAHRHYNVYLIPTAPLLRLHWLLAASNPTVQWKGAQQASCNRCNKQRGRGHNNLAPLAGVTAEV